MIGSIRLRIYRRLIAVLITPFVLLWASKALSQDNYEIQVYGSETVKPQETMVELHSNYTVQGEHEEMNGVYPSQNQLHETVEITHGLTNTFETGFYLFTSAQHAQGWQVAGSHLRPRWRAPNEWELPVGVSLSMEVGYVRPQYSSDTWTMEIRPIVDKKLGSWYVALNPALEKSFAGASASKGFEFSPDITISYDVTQVITLGIEYYSSLGPIFSFDPLHEQQHQIVPALDLNLGEEWEFNFGIAIGLTPATDHTIVKMIVGRRF